jgi:predicted nucleotidyltransferase
MVPEEKIKTFVDKIRNAAGENLESIILYGSAASGEYHPEFSNVNLFCVLRDSSYSRLRALAPVMKWWERQKQPPPLFMTRHELEHSTDIFTIELIDMQQHHKVLWGDDPVAVLHIPMRLHRVQVEYELREKLILLRQHLMLAGEDNRRVWELLVRSVASFATLFRHALIALGETAPATRREAIVRLSHRIGFDPAPIEDLLDFRERKTKAKAKKGHADAIVSAYLAAMQQVIAAVDTIDEPDTSGRSLTNQKPPSGGLP